MERFHCERVEVHTLCDEVMIYLYKNKDDKSAVAYANLSVDEAKKMYTELGEKIFKAQFEK